MKTSVMVDDTSDKSHFGGLFKESVIPQFQHFGEQSCCKMTNKIIEIT